MEWIVLRLSFLFQWGITLLIGWITYNLVKHFLTARSLPPGPFPLPVLGNLLNFVGVRNRKDIFSQHRKKFGNIYTLWFGKMPAVVINGWEEAKDALVTKRNAFAGRPRFLLFEIVMHGGVDIAICDFGKRWEVMVKVGHSAIRKYMNTDKLPELIHDVVNETSRDIIEEGTLSPFKSIYLIVFNILATSAFSKRFTKDDKDFKMLMENNDEFHDLLASGFLPDFIPWLRPFYRKLENKLREVTLSTQGYFEKQIAEHKQTYISGKMRDFADAVLSAREEAEKEDSDSKLYLDDISLMFIVADLFSAGSDTTQGSLKWLFLYLAYMPEMQEKIFNELTEKIGDRMATHEDKLNCPYTNAVISEVLRMRIPAPLGIPHKATCDTSIGSYKIPKDTAVFINIESIHMDEDYWPDPNTFKPERFLDEDGNHITKSLSHYLPFGLGRRSCIGQLMARTDLFLILAGIIRNCKLSLPPGVPVDFNPKESPLNCEPKDYQLIVKSRKSAS